MRNTGQVRSRGRLVAAAAAPTSSPAAADKFFLQLNVYYNAVAGNVCVRACAAAGVVTNTVALQILSRQDLQLQILSQVYMLGHSK